jgi:hypothetical protein
MQSRSECSKWLVQHTSIKRIRTISWLLAMCPALAEAQVTGSILNVELVNSTVYFNAIGWPGLVDTYRVDFQIPAGASPGQASIQLSSAWITGPPVNVPIQ